MILDGKRILEEYGRRNDPQPERFLQAVEALRGRTLVGALRYSPRFRDRNAVTTWLASSKST
jgi:hypothetical protein